MVETASPQTASVSASRTAPVGPLVGFAVGVTADRRRDELAAMLRRRGARVVEAPLVRIAPIDDDTQLYEATQRCVAAPLDYVVATTGVGWRGWMSAAAGYGLDDALLATCRAATVLSRGPKATGAVRACGLRETWSPASEAVDELLDWLLARDVAGSRIAVQEHGAPLPAFAAALRERGAEVVEVPVYRWLPPADPAAAARMCDAVCRRELAAVTFTSAPAAEALLAAARSEVQRSALLDALGHDVLAACIGPVCARPLQAAGVPVAWPKRGRLGELARLVVDQLEPRRTTFQARGLPVTVQGNAVIVAGTVLTLQPASAALLRALAGNPGRVLSRPELAHRLRHRGHTRLPASPHALEAAVARLRTGLGEYAWLVATVTKRGYRLAAEP